MLVLVLVGGLPTWEADPSVLLCLPWSAPVDESSVTPSSSSSSSRSPAIHTSSHAALSA